MGGISKDFFDVQSGLELKKTVVYMIEIFQLSWKFVVSTILT